MTTSTLSAIQIDNELSRLEPLAQAEAAFKAANPHEECPASWDGASARIETLKKEQHAIALAARGELLAAKLKEKHAIEERIEKAKLERERADKHCADLAADPAVARFLQGGSEARRRGFGYSWAADFAPWFLSRRARHAGLREEGAFFLDATRCPPVLLFTERDRDIVCQHHEARGAAILALTILDAEMQQHAALLRSFPELASVA
jgi:hypothetical protein